MRKNKKQRRFAKTSVMEQPLLLQRCRRSTTSLKKKRKLFAIRVVSVPFAGGSHIGKSLLSRFGVCQEFSSAEFCSVECRHPEDFLSSSSLREDLHSFSLQEARDYWALKTSCCCFRRFYLCCFAQLLEYMTSSSAQRQWIQHLLLPHVELAHILGLLSPFPCCLHISDHSHNGLFLLSFSNLRSQEHKQT